MRVDVYADGSCSRAREGSPGGWGCYITFEDGRINEIYGGVTNTTNQRMELMACVQALLYLTSLEGGKPAIFEVLVHSDSAYVVNCMAQGWWKKWERNGWITARGTLVEHQDLWKNLIKLRERFRSVNFVKVGGHSGNYGNDIADNLANKGKAPFLNKKPIDVVSRD